MSDCEISLFPIPESVSFPFSKVPLHVFEPRYRAMVRDADRLKRRVAVCHTKKLIGRAKHTTSLEEALKSNQENYEPCRVFSAGFVHIQHVTEDGRIVVEIEMDGRYEQVEEIQTIPYRVARCRPYVDIAERIDEQKIFRMRTAIDAMLVKISEEAKSPLIDLFRGQEWRDLPVEEYSFRIFKFIQFDAQLMQTILEMKSLVERLSFLHAALMARN